MAEFTDLNTTNGLVRKWRKIALAISDYSDPAVTIPKLNEDVWDLSNSDPLLKYTPMALPTGAKKIGYITTDGVSDTKDVNSDGTDMLQSVEPVRTDITSVEKSMQVAFGESNAWTNALRAGLPVSQWPASKNSAWSYADGKVIDNPYYVLWLLAQDGVGKNAFYRFELGLKVKVTGMESRKMNASDPEVFGFTFGFFKDDVTGYSHLRSEEGPGYQNHLAEGGQLLPVAAAVDPLG